MCSASTASVNQVPLFGKSDHLETLEIMAGPRQPVPLHGDRSLLNMLSYGSTLYLAMAQNCWKKHVVTLTQRPCKSLAIRLRARLGLFPPSIGRQRHGRFKEGE